MSEEKQKNEEKRKNRQVEWSFSFADLGQRIDEFVESMGVSGDEAIKTEYFNEPLGSATTASIRLDTPVGETIVRAAEGDVLIDAEITHVGDVQFAVSGETDKQVTLSQKTDPKGWMRGIFGWIGSTGRLRWNVALNPSIPLDIDIHSGLGKATYDFRVFKLVSLDVHGGTGEINVVLPASPDLLKPVINGGVGEVEVEVPAGANVDAQIRAGTGRIALRIGADAAVNALIKGGVGECDIYLPPGAEARIEANLGMGNVSVGRQFAQVSGSSANYVGHSGVWQTVGYETAERKITIRFDGGVGGLVVR